MAKRKAVADKAICVACGECEHVCPRNAIHVWKGIHAKTDFSLCVGCGICARNCPAGCIVMEDME